MKKVLIANRGEIALRLQAACHMLGLQTVAVFSQEDGVLSYVSRADEAYKLSGNGYKAYLAQDEIIAIARACGADAIHPGYGFLSENAGFACKVKEAGLGWIGPSPDLVALMGDKIAARKMALDAAVPIVPGFMVSDLASIDLEEVCQKARGIGYPVLVKDPLGGGGKGMQLVGNDQELMAALCKVWNQAQRMSIARLLLVEKYLDCVRHVEIQVAGDGKTAIHLFERECSVQRRYQKIIEESPCCFVSDSVLEKMRQAAVMLAKTIGYDSVGTVEFVVTEQEQFYFLEMNTRLQVEHAVTEMVTGIDIACLQIKLAQKQNLPFVQHDISSRGHAIECRVYAEDAGNNFLPSAGIAHVVDIPQLPWIRIDCDMHSGVEITPFFDPMILKCVAWGSSRYEARGRMCQFLKKMHIVGIKTNINFLIAILQSELFALGNIYTSTLQNHCVVQDFVQSQESFEETEQDYALSALTALLAMNDQFSQAEEPLVVLQKNREKWKRQLWQ